MCKSEEEKNLREILCAKFVKIFSSTARKDSFMRKTRRSCELKIAVVGHEKWRAKLRLGFGIGQRQSRPPSFCS